MRTWAAGAAGASVASSTAWAVPHRIGSGDDLVTISRAWPGSDKHGAVRVTVEGRDPHGRLRAGTVGPDGSVDLLPTGADPRLPALARLAPEAELVVHRAGRRAVLRHTGGYTKIVRPGRSEGVAEAARAGRRLALAAGLDAPDVVRHQPEDAAVTMTVLPGRPVSDLSAGADWQRIWATWATAWTRLQELDPARHAPGLAPHTSADEAEVVGRWAGRASAAGVLPDVWVRRAEHAQARLAAAGEAERLVPTHRDLHDKQLLWDGERLGVLDLDTACLADPVVDPANLAVHADLRRAQGEWSHAAARTVEVTAQLVARVAGVDGERWQAARLATVARLACVYAFRPTWRELVLDWASDRWVALGGGHATA
ncbi:hypothetical protein GCM10009584_05040 [Ornithinimicrobium humiphilum]|uniref:Aminoglycoside phosphotransferase (APT) family kinase protein n=1 Tax=Ornithinimicrobium humiphilum TaxID=125288 RepID=A0A543K840_9MICO|nr:aminoglycoside phosphotransferase family protein [Ornithinimicrobium humiphilum]TQM91230.1 aminoglycoside phosphotransferase (APT) family kinase protein [Ornithinimicrobium humiphilum]